MQTMCNVFEEFGKEMREEGLQEGLQKGRQESEERLMSLLEKLSQKLTAIGRAEDLSAAACDRQKLLGLARELGIEY